MGRPSTGSWTVYESLRIELSYLLRSGFIKKNCVISFNLNWNDQRGNSTGNISCISSYMGTEDTNYLELIYTLTNNSTDTKTNRRYKVYLHEQDSNLGKGKVLYFVCPVSGRNCRILYSAYGSHYFKAREAYQNRLYYDCQMASKLSRYNDAFWRIESHLKKINKRTNYGHRRYKDLTTKAAQRFNRLFQKQCYLDELRWTLGAPKSLRRIFDSDRA
jgi:hypothetical protein